MSCLVRANSSEIPFNDTYFAPLSAIDGLADIDELRRLYARDGVVLVFAIYAGILVGALCHLAFPASQSLMTRSTPEDAQGELQGAIVGSYSLSSVIGPLMMAPLFGACRCIRVLFSGRPLCDRGGAARGGAFHICACGPDERAETGADLIAMRGVRHNDTGWKR